MSGHRRSVSIALQTDKTANRYATLGTMVEDLGFDGLSMFADLGYQPPAGPMAVVARATTRLRLGVACQNPALLHPVEIAGQVAALDLASRGRAYAGMVTGSWLDQLGIEESRPLTRLKEAVEVVRRLLARDTSGFAGEQFTLAAGAGLTYEPLRRGVPLLIGTWRPRAAAFAATVADEVKIGGCANPDMVRLMREWLGPDGPRIVVGAVTVVGEDGDAARRRAAEEVRMYLDVVGRLDPTLEVAPGEPVPLEKFVLAGTPDDVARQTIALIEAGAYRVEFGTPQGRTTEEGVALLCDRVLPAMR